MVSLKQLKKRGVSAEAWKKVFTDPENLIPTFDPNATANTPTVPQPAETDKEKKQKPFTGLNALRNRMRTRIKEGRDYNFSHYQLYKGLDDAFDVPLKKAVTPTLLTMLSDKSGSEAELKAELSAWGFNLDDVMLESPDTKVDGKSVKKVSAPAFFQVFVPLVKAYLTIRQAKILNDMLVSPFFNYRPAWESARSRAQCDAITSRMEVMSEQFSYYDTIKQGVFGMLHYGRSFQFPQEEWYSEEQEVESAEDASTEDGEPLMNSGKEYYAVTKEGLRYHHPHITRTFWDQAHPACSFNSDTGGQFAGYWRVNRYREVLGNSAYYNTQRVSIGNYGWYGTNATFFNTVYPCHLEFPGVVGAAANDRESQMIDNVYSQDMGDKAVVVTEYFEKLIPKDYGLGDYPYPIWCRFVVAGDDTVIYAAPLPYAPVVYYGYDDDQNRAQTASLSLEILPFQDHLSNLLTQYLLAVKQNLANITFVDEDMVTPKTKGLIENLGEKLFRKRNFAWFSGRRFKMAQQAVPTAFYSHSFPQLDTNGIIQAVKMTLDICERVLQMSSQELGAAASHEQTKAEVVSIGKQTSTRLAYTTTPVIQARHAIMKQLYLADMAYGVESFWAQIPMDRRLDIGQLKELGFTYREEEHSATYTDSKLVVRVQRSAIMLESFASFRLDEERSENPEAAMAMFQSLVALFNGPMGQAIGAEQGIELVNLIGRVAGWPKDYRLKNMAPNAQQQSAEMQKALAEQVQGIEAKILGEVKQGLMPMLKQDQATAATVKQLEEAVAHITQIIDTAQAHRPALALGGAPVVNGAPVNGAMMAA